VCFIAHPLILYLCNINLEENLNPKKSGELVSKIKEDIQE